MISAQISWRNFFEKVFLQGLGALFTAAKPLIWVSFFSTKKNIFILFFKCDYLPLIHLKYENNIKK